MPVVKKLSKLTNTIHMLFVFVFKSWSSFSLVYTTILLCTGASCVDSLLLYTTKWSTRCFFGKWYEIYLQFYDVLIVLICFWSFLRIFIQNFSTSFELRKKFWFLRSPAKLLESPGGTILVIVVATRARIKKMNFFVPLSKYL